MADLASTVTDKLEFLEVNCADLSKLQILLLQMEVGVLLFARLRLALIILEACIGRTRQAL